MVNGVLGDYYNDHQLMIRELTRRHVKEVSLGKKTLEYVGTWLHHRFYTPLERYTPAFLESLDGNIFRGFLCPLSMHLGPCFWSRTYIAVLRVCIVRGVSGDLFRI